MPTYRSDCGKDVGEDPVDALLFEAASIASAPELEQCPDDRELIAYFSGNPTHGKPTINSDMDRHMATCDDCRERFIQHKLGCSGPLDHAGTRLWSSSIAVTVLGPGSADPRQLQKASMSLTRKGAQCNEDEEGDLLYVTDTSFNGEGSGHVDTTKLIAWLHFLRTIVEKYPSVGGLVTLSRGYIEKERPVGAALSEARSHASKIVAGQVRFAPDLVGYLEPLGVRYRRVLGHDLLVFTGDEEDAQDVRELVPTLGDKVRGFVLGTATAFQGLVEATVDASASRRRAAARSLRAKMVAPDSDFIAPQLTLKKGDQLIADFKVPDGNYVYALRQSDMTFALPNGGKALRRPGDPMKRSVSVTLNDNTAYERLLLLVTPRPILGLEGAVYRTNGFGRGTAQERLESLAQLLREEHDASNLLVLYSRFFEHVAIEPPDESFMASIRTAAEQNDVESLKALVSTFLERDPSAAEASEAHLLLGRVFRRKGKSEKADQELELAATLAETVGDTGLLGDILRDKAWLAVGRAEWKTCEEIILQAIHNHRSLRDAIGDAKDHLCLGWLRVRQGKLAEAYQEFSSVVEPARQAGEAAIELGALAMLGQVCQDLGRLPEATECLSRALDLNKDTDDLRAQFRLHGDIGRLELVQGRLVSAVRHLRLHSGLADAMASPDEKLHARISLVDGLLASGRYDEARSVLEDLHREKANLDSDLLASLRLFSGELELATGHSGAAGKWLELQDNLTSVALPVRWRTALARGRWMEAVDNLDAREAFEQGVTLVEADRDQMPRVLRTSLLDVSGALFEGWISHLARYGASLPDLLGAVERSRARAFLDSLYSRTLPAEFAEFETPTPASLLRSVEPIAAFQDKIEPQVSFLVYYVLRDRLLVFGVSKHEIVLEQKMVSQKELLRLCIDVAQWQQTPPGQAGGPSLDPSGRLAEYVLEPLRSWLERREEGTPLGLVSHGPLHEVALHALPWTDGEPLALSHSIFYAPSLSAVSHWLDSPPPATEGILAMADIHGDLERARLEADSAVEILGGGEKLIGAKATARALEAEGGHARFLHLAVHARRASRDGGAAMYFAPVPDISAEARDFALSSGAQVEGPLTGEVGPAWISRLKLDAELVVASACYSGAADSSRSGERPDLIAWAFLAAGARSVIAGGWDLNDDSTSRIIKRFYEYLNQGKSKVQALADAQEDSMRGRLPPVSTLGEREFELWDKGVKELQLWDEGVGPTESLLESFSHPYYWAGLQLVGDWR